VTTEETRAELEEVLSHEVKNAIVGWTQAEAHSTPAELLQAARPILEEWHAKQEREAADVGVDGLPHVGGDGLDGPDQSPETSVIVVGYGRIIPKWMLELPRYGNLNLHASLLPMYRGAAPIQWAIANGEKVTGVTTMRIDEGLDTGDILLQQELGIAEDDTAETLAPRLAAIGADLMIETLSRLQATEITPKPQNHSEATLAPILTKEHGSIDFRRPAQEIYNRLRGFQPWPGAFTKFRGKVLAVTAARPVRQLNSQPSLGDGQLLLRGSQLLVGCGQSTVLELLEVQPEGKKRMAASDFARGYRPSQDERLSS